MNSAEIKRWFKTKYGIPVRVRTVQVKHPFCQVWIQSDKTPKIHDPLKYSFQFPDEVGQALLKIIYGPDSPVGKQTWGGNIQPHRLSFDQYEWEQLQKLVP